MERALFCVCARGEGKRAARRRGGRAGGNAPRTTDAAARATATSSASLEANIIEVENVIVDVGIPTFAWRLVDAFRGRLGQGPALMAFLRDSWGLDAEKGKSATLFYVRGVGIQTYNIFLEEERKIGCVSGTAFVAPPVMASFPMPVKLLTDGRSRRRCCRGPAPAARRGRRCRAGSPSRAGRPPAPHTARSGRQQAALRLRCAAEHSAG